MKSREDRLDGIERLYNEMSRWMGYGDEDFEDYDVLDMKEDMKIMSDVIKDSREILMELYMEMVANNDVI